MLSNQSAYRVSYWVAQEDKKRTADQYKSIVSSIALRLNGEVGNINNNLGVARNDLSKNAIRTPTSEDPKNGNTGGAGGVGGATTLGLSRDPRRPTEGVALSNVGDSGSSGSRGFGATAALSGSSGDVVRTTPTPETLDDNNNNAAEATSLFTSGLNPRNIPPGKNLYTDNNTGGATKKMPDKTDKKASTATRSNVYLDVKGASHDEIRRVEMQEEEEGGDAKTVNPDEAPIDIDSDVYFLTRDHRMGAAGQTQPTKIAFPIDCRGMRVYAFFEVNGLWRIYKEKVYSIGLFKKVFTFTSFDVNIAPHVDKRSRTPVPVSPLKVILDIDYIYNMCIHEPFFNFPPV